MPATRTARPFRSTMPRRRPVRTVCFVPDITGPTVCGSRTSGLRAFKPEQVTCWDCKRNMQAQGSGE